MDAKLEVVRVNEDVIATSGGVGQLMKKPIDPTYKFVWWLNNTNYESMNKADGSATDYQGYSENNAWYHCDANGNIIEKCTHSQNEGEVYAAHGIKLPQ